MCAFGADLMDTALQRRLNFIAAVASNVANIADATAAGGHLPNPFVCTGMAALIVEIMAANKLPCHSPSRSIFACCCRICRFALFFVYG